jgi:hypothetical protein
MIRIGIFLTIVVVAGGWYAGGFLGSGYSRVVDRPEAQVVAALEDLDITAQPGNPGTDPSRSGGALPDIRLEKAQDRMTWWVMSGTKVAIKMTATLTPIDGGKRTKVTTSVERGDAPDDVVSPAFRSTGITSGLFSMAVEGELNKLVAPPREREEFCRGLMDKFTASNEANREAEGKPRSLGQALAAGAKTTLRLQAMEDEMRRQGCPTEPAGGFKDVQSKMGPAEPEMRPAETPPSDRATPAPDTAGDGIPDER